MYEENENKDLNGTSEGSGNTSFTAQNNGNEAETNSNEYRYDRSFYQGQENSTYYTNSDNNQNQSGSQNNYSSGSQSSYDNTYSSANQQQQAYSAPNQQYYTGGQSYQNQANGNASKPGKKKNGFLKVATKVVAAVVAIGVIGVGGYFGIDKIVSNHSSKEVSTVSTNKGSSTNNNVTTVSNSTTAVVTDVSQVVENTMPCVVSISNVGTQQYTNMFGQTGTYAAESSGSGIIIGQNDDELLIVTNQHVVEGADTLSAGFIDGKSATANVKGSDSAHDIAVIAIEKKELDEDTLNNIKVATLGDSNNLKVGEPAIAIGNALGYGQSVTCGVISALNREVSVENTTNKLIQTDAAINPGNSGGALLNMAGEVIGINSVKYADTEVEGMGYAIPISDISSLIDDLMNKETKKKVSNEEQSYMGISCVDVTSSVAKTYNMPEGVYVAQVEKDSPAEKAGIKKGDIITKISDSTVSSYSELTQELQYHAAGTKVTVVVQTPTEKGYGYEEKSYDVELGKKKDSDN